MTPADSEMQDSALVVQTSERLKKFVDFLIDYRLYLLTLAALLALLAYQPAQQLTLERSIESLFAPDDPLLLSFRDSQQLFGGDEFVLVAWKEQYLLQPATLREVENFANQLSRIPGINSASTQTLPRVLQPPELGFLANLFLKIPSIQNQVLNFAEGALVGDDRETVAVILRLLPEAETPVTRTETVRQIRQLAMGRPEPTYVVGESVQVDDMFQIVEEDGRLLGWASAAILLLIMLVLFRSIRWMLLPIVVVQVSLLWTRAALVVSGMQLSMVSSMLNSLVTIIGIATVMHLTVTFRSYRRQLPRLEAFRNSLIDLLPAIGWSIATTAIGFGALMSSRIIPIQSFGLMMGIGTISVWLAVLLILPGGVLIGNISVDPRETAFGRLLASFLLTSLKTTQRYSKSVLSLFVILFLFGLLGFSFLKIETDFSRNFHPDSPIVQSLEFVESNLGGAGNYEIRFPFSTLKDAQELQKLRNLAAELRTISVAGDPAVTKVIAYTDGIDFIPPLAARTLEQKQELLSQIQPEFIPGLYNAEKGQMRIVLRALERLPAEQKLEMIAAITATARKYFPTAECTGLYVLLANIILSLLSDQLVSFSLAALGIFLMMCWAFRRWRWGLITMLPNLFPIVVLVGGLGWFGSLVNIGTAMIASVSVGLTVDSSIHYLSAYRRQLQSGCSHQQALEWTQQEIGQSLFYSNLALVFGFSVLLLSQFVPLNYFGLLVSIAMLGGLVGNLVLLPILLDRFRAVTTLV